MAPFLKISKTCGENMFIYRVRYAESHGPHENVTGLKKQPFVTKKLNFPKKIKGCQKMFFIWVGGSPRTTGDLIKPKKSLKKGAKTCQKRPKIGQDRPR